MTLSDQKMKELLDWLETSLELNGIKKLNRDFSDAVLMAHCLCKMYPKLVEIHNYPAVNSLQQKLVNWEVLNRKVLRKIGLEQNQKSLENFATAVPGAIEEFLYQVYCISACGKDQPSCDRIQNDDNNGTIRIVDISKANGENVIQEPIRMICYTFYESLLKKNNEQNEKINSLQQKISTLENLLKFKSQRIEDLMIQLIGKHLGMDDINNRNR